MTTLYYGLTDNNTVLNIGGTSTTNCDIAFEDMVTVDQDTVPWYDHIAPWYSQAGDIETLNFVNSLSPSSTAYWFYGCSLIMTINNINNLDTSNVIDMSCMFTYCSGLGFLDNFNLDLSNFNTSNVTNMRGMFRGCMRLTSLDLSNFDTSKVRYMGEMFSGCSSLTSLNVSNFNTSNVTNMENMFDGCSSLTSLNVSNFNTSNVENMYGMFEDCTSLTSLNVSNFNTSNVTDMYGMFKDCGSLTSLDLSNFDTSNVTDMRFMFNNCNSLTSLNLSNFDTSEVTNMSSMFKDCDSLTLLDLSSFDISNVENMQYMFNNCSSLQKIYVSNLWNTQNVITSISMFSGCTSLIGQNNFTYNPSYVDKTFARIDEPDSPGYFTDIRYKGYAYAIFDGINTLIFFRSENTYTNVFQTVEDIYGTSYHGTVYTGIEALDAQGISYIPWSSQNTYITTITFAENQIIKPISTAYWFYDLQELTTINNINNLDTSNVTNMSNMFHNCSELESLNLSNFDTSNVSSLDSMSNMFSGCESLTLLDLSNWDTSNVRNMSSMFNNCSSLISLNLSNFNTSNVRNMLNMFNNCSNLSSIAIGENFRFTQDMAFPADPHEISEGIRVPGTWGRTKDSSGESVSNTIYYTLEDLIENYPSEVGEDETYAPGTYEAQKKEYLISYKFNNKIIKTEWATEDSVIALEEESNIDVKLVAYWLDQAAADYTITEIPYHSFFDYKDSQNQLISSIIVTEPVVITMEQQEEQQLPSYPDQPERQDFVPEKAKFMGWNTIQSLENVIPAEQSDWALSDNVLYAVYDILSLILQQKVRNPEKEQNNNAEDWIILNNIYQDSSGNIYPESAGKSSEEGNISVNNAGTANSGIYIEKGKVKEVNYNIYTIEQEEKFLSITVNDDDQSQTLKIPYPTEGDYLQIPSPDGETIKLVDGKLTAVPAGTWVDNLTTVVQKNSGDEVNVIDSITIGEDDHLESITINKIKLPQSPIIATTMEPTSSDILIWIDTN